MKKRIKIPKGYRVNKIRERMRKKPFIKLYLEKEVNVTAGLDLTNVPIRENIFDITKVGDDPIIVDYLGEKGSAKVKPTDIDGVYDVIVKPINCADSKDLKKKKKKPNESISKKMDKFLDKIDKLCFDYGYEIYPTELTFNGIHNTITIKGQGESQKVLFVDGDGRLTL